MNRRVIAWLLVSLVCYSGSIACMTALLGAQHVAAKPKAIGPQIVVHFSPKGGCTDTVVDNIGQAKSQILIHSYSFTSQPIVDALSAAIARKVSVQMVLDKSAGQDTRCKAVVLQKLGMKIHTASCHGIAHSKVMLIDNVVILTGSFNWTGNAEYANQENSLVISNCPDLMQQYQANFMHCWDTGTPYVAPPPQEKKHK